MDRVEQLKALIKKLNETEMGIRERFHEELGTVRDEISRAEGEAIFIEKGYKIGSVVMVREKGIEPYRMKLSEVEKYSCRGYKYKANGDLYKSDQYQYGEIIEVLEV